MSYGGEIPDDIRSGNYFFDQDNKEDGN